MASIFCPVKSLICRSILRTRYDYLPTEEGIDNLREAIIRNLLKTKISREACLLRFNELEAWIIAYEENHMYRKGDNKWLLLSYVKAYKTWVTTGGKLNIFVSVDATASGMQILAQMQKVTEEKTLKSLNILENEGGIIGDFYYAIIKEYIWTVKAEENLTINVDGVRYPLLEAVEIYKEKNSDLINSISKIFAKDEECIVSGKDSDASLKILRKILKNVMTLGYGVGCRSFCDTVVSRIEELKISGKYEEVVGFAKEIIEIMFNDYGKIVNFYRCIEANPVFQLRRCLSKEKQILAKEAKKMGGVIDSLMARCQKGEAMRDEELFLKEVRLVLPNLISRSKKELEKMVTDFPNLSFTTQEVLEKNVEDELKKIPSIRGKIKRKLNKGCKAENI